MELVLVQGDICITAAVSIGACCNGVLVDHVKAGLRTDNKWQPFPEEINRKVEGAITDLHFGSTERARQNLSREGVSPGQTLFTGNPVIDALL